MRACDLSASSSMGYGTTGVVGLATGVADGSAESLVMAPDFDLFNAVSSRSLHRAA